MKKGILLFSLWVLVIAWLYFFDGFNSTMQYIDGKQNQKNVQWNEKLIKNEHSAPIEQKKWIDSKTIIKVDSAQDAANLDINVIENPKAEYIDLPYQDLASELKNNIVNKTPVKEIIPEEWKQRTFIVSLSDEKGEWIWWVSVSLRWWFLWVTDSEWKLTVDKKIPEEYTYLYFQFEKKWYTPWFVKQLIGSILAKEIFINARLSQLWWKILTTSTEKLTVTDEKITLTINNDSWCALKNADGKCHVWAVDIDYNFIHPSQLEKLTIPMQWVVDWSMRWIESNGMAFIRFYDKNWDRLIHNNSPTKVCYTLDSKDIENRQKTSQPENKDMDGYRWFDYSSGIWKFDTEAIVEITDNSFCATSKYVY